MSCRFIAEEPLSPTEQRLDGVDGLLSTRDEVAADPVVLHGGALHEEEAADLQVDSVLFGLGPLHLAQLGVHHLRFLVGLASIVRAADAWDTPGLLVVGIAAPASASTAAARALGE